MTPKHAVTTILHEADATYSWLLPDGTILPVTGQRRHEAVAGDYYRERFKKNLEGGTYEDWAKAQGWARLVGTGFEAGKLTKQLLRRVQQTYLDAGVREMGTSFFIDISGPGGRDMQVFEVPYRDFLDIINPGELRRYKFESRTATLESKGQVHRLFGEGLDDDITIAKRQFIEYLRVLDEETPDIGRSGLSLLLRYYSLLGRSGRVRVLEEDAPHVTDLLDQFAIILGTVGGYPGDVRELAEYVRYVDKAREHLSVVMPLKHEDYLTGGGFDTAGSPEKAEVLRAYSTQIRRWEPRSFGRGQDTTLEDQGSLSWGDLTDIKFEDALPDDFIVPSVMSGGDYANSSTLQRSNYLGFMRDYGGEAWDENDYEVEVVSSSGVEEPEEEDGGYEGIWGIFGGYGTYGVAIQISMENEDVWEVLDGLTDYPVYNEEDMSTHESNLEYQAWQSWGADEYQRELEKLEDLSPENLAAVLEHDLLDDLFRRVSDANSIYWEADGEDMFIRMENVADATSDEDLVAVLGERTREQEVATGQQFMAFDR